MKTRLLAALFTVCALLGTSQGADRDKLTDINAGLAQAKTENKLLFVQYGREACGNCQALKGYIKDRSLRLSESKYVYVDANCDDSSTSQAFRSKFKVEGKTLPFVVVAAPDGTQLAARTGYGSVKEYEDLLKEAQKASKSASSSASKP
ncbi:thioredoxin-like protein [Roseimicrobium gellanilyticum]|uniref:Thioredoxin-like protein n=1 Tax=Roseimicrobium gellanilyticum TaxID=748857 RepID=A0A366H2H8_9BACT|nr:thioredoxin family protein [Roseimicrobium gellanilyticum]RBP36111.1 thioredoxin-like protein [Roseimicrobium gellanilyticum]